jgi:glycosyl transferase family 2
MGQPSPTPQVTVIIATYNCSRVLRCALLSLCNQNFKDFEAWVVGDCCTDDSEQVVAGLADPRLYWTNLPQRGGSQCEPNNEGLRRARGKYIAYLGHDDLWFPWHLASLVQIIEREHADFADAGVILTGPGGPVRAYGDGRRTAQGNSTPPSGWLHRREVAEKCGPWPRPEAKPLGLDMGFQSRAFLAGFCFVPSWKMSVLKFPSHWWRTYARHGGYPQESYWARMAEDPVKLHGQVLTELVFAYMRLCHAPTVPQSLESAARVLWRKFSAWYGADRWPMPQYVFWRNARHRKRATALRGLTESGDSSGDAG